MPPSGGGGNSNPRFVKSGTGTAEATKSSAQTITHDGCTFVKDPKTDYWYRQSEAKTIDGGRTYYWPPGSNKYIKKYAMGGLADFTGPAWVDGSKAKPERILSPYQTVLFEDLISSLHDIRVKTPMMTAIPQMPQTVDRVFHIESIQVNVERLKEDADYEAMAQKVGEYLYGEIARGAPVGGFRLGR